MFYDLLLLTISDPEKDKTSFLCSNRDRLDFDVGDATGFGTVLLQKIPTVLGQCRWGFVVEDACFGTV